MFSENFDRVAFSKTLQSKLYILRAASEKSQSHTANALGIIGAAVFTCGVIRRRRAYNE